MKRTLFALSLAIFGSLFQAEAMNLISVNVAPAIKSELSLPLITNVRRDATPYLPVYNTSVRLLSWSDNSTYQFTRNSATPITLFAYSPYAMCDGKVMKIQGYYTDYDVTPTVTYAYLFVTIGSNTYNMYWPAYFYAGSFYGYQNYMQPA